MRIRIQALVLRACFCKFGLSLPLCGILRMALSKRKPAVRYAAVARDRSLKEAGERLLVGHHHDEVTVDWICREAGKSVGAFYNGFDSKDHFLSDLIHERFRDARTQTNRRLAALRGDGLSASELIPKVVEIVARELTQPRMVGVARAALRLGSFHPQAFSPLTEYRETVTAAVVQLLAQKLSVNDAEFTVCCLMQVLFATLMDAVQSDKSMPLRLGWILSPNFHFGFMATGCCWTDTAISAAEYMGYWLKRIHDARQIERREWDLYWKTLEQEKIAQREDRETFDRYFTNTGRASATPRPGIQCAFDWHLEEAERLDARGKFKNAVKGRINTLLEALGEQPISTG